MHFYSKIRFRLFLTFCCLAIVPTIIITYISYENFTTLINKEVNTLSSNLMDNAYKDLKYTLNSINDITRTFHYQQSSSKTGVISILRKYTDNNDPPTAFERLQDSKELDALCGSIIYNNSYINGISIFMADGTSYSKGYRSNLRYGYTPFEDQWYQKTLEKQGKLYISEISLKDFLISTSPSITFSRVLYDTSTQAFLGVLLIDCSLDIFKSIDLNSITDVTDIYLINQNGETVYTNATNLEPTLDHKLYTQLYNHYSGYIDETAANTLYAYNTLTDYNWKLVAKINTKKLISEFDTRNLIIALGFICIILFILLSLILSDWITKPITKLSSIMSKQSKDLVVTKNKALKRKDEVGVLYNQYNYMIEMINSHIKESYHNKLISLDSQMKALEAQINSHFLYNTLEAINSIAEIEEIESIATMTKALGDMFRYSIKTKSELVNINEEMSHVLNYLAIQKIRYEDKLQFELNIPDTLYRYRILKLILQPIVENAVQHGLVKKKHGGKVVIRGYEEKGCLYFEVEDNGMGMDQNQIEEIHKVLNEPPKFTELGQRTSRSIGIKNVHSRIQLYYGNECGITFYSEREIGTTFKIKVPKRV